MKTPSKTDWKRLAAMEDKDIDTSDIPELGDVFFQNAALRVPVKKPVAPSLKRHWMKSQLA
ncbi:3-oxoacyl-ACP synthase [Leucothrix pacifica]|nr:3-oxoacyl-ACP synthase [Leucothrix pacifica]